MNKLSSNCEGAGRFSHTAWEQCDTIAPISSLTVGSDKINVAKFSAMYNTDKKFTPFSAGKLSTILNDNISVGASYTGLQAQISSLIVV